MDDNSTGRNYAVTLDDGRRLALGDITDDDPTTAGPLPQTPVSVD